MRDAGITLQRHRLLRHLPVSSSLIPRPLIPELEDIGERLYEARAQFMVDTDQGLTKTYNALKDPAVHDPRVEELRQLHIEMDQAVLAAYAEHTGDKTWLDIEVPPTPTPKPPPKKPSTKPSKTKSSTTSSPSTNNARTDESGHTKAEKSLRISARTQGPSVLCS